jgi:hypothetical protein
MPSKSNKPSGDKAAPPKSGAPKAVEPPVEPPLEPPFEPLVEPLVHKTAPLSAVVPEAPGQSAEPDAGPTSKRKPTSAADIAAALAAGTHEPPLIHYAKALDDDNPNAAAQGARVIEELVLLKPELCAPHIERLVRGLWSQHPRVVQAAAVALPVLGKVAPAKVARHLERLQSGFEAGSEIAKDGIVRTLVALCLASVAYQRRVVDVLEKALGGAEPKTLQRWTEVVLPALKGEPHAQARSAVERRLPELPRPIAEKIAEQLGIKLRPSMYPR